MIKTMTKVALAIAVLTSGIMAEVKVPQKKVPQKNIGIKAESFSKSEKMVKMKEKKPLPVLEKKQTNAEKEKALRYDKIISILSKVDDDKMVKENLGEKLKEGELSDEERAAMRNSQLEMLEEFLLPEPVGIIVLSDKKEVFAKIRTNVVKHDKNDAGSPVSDIFNSEEIRPAKTYAFGGLSLSFSTKTIRIKIGDVFGDWKISHITNSAVVYKNTKTKKTITKNY